MGTSWHLEGLKGLTAEKQALLGEAGAITRLYIRIFSLKCKLLG